MFLIELRGGAIAPARLRLLRTLQRVSRSLTKRYEPVFTRLAVVKVSLRLATYQHVRPPSFECEKLSQSRLQQGKLLKNRVVSEFDGCQSTNFSWASDLS